MGKIDIGTAVHELHARIWRGRVALGIDAGSPIDMLDPAIGAAVLGFRYEVHEDLGTFGNRGDRFGVAGLIDRPRGLIMVSRRFSPAAQRFTGAHELGHLVLHPGQIMHRDRPLDGGSRHQVLNQRPQTEVEADHFAAQYLMPTKTLTNRFRMRFGDAHPIEINDEAGFWLCPHEPERVLECGAEELAAIIATATRYKGRTFPPLAEEFKVSVSSIAIRLLELGLV